MSMSLKQFFVSFFAPPDPILFSPLYFKAEDNGHITLTGSLPFGLRWGQPIPVGREYAYEMYFTGTMADTVLYP